MRAYVLGIMLTAVGCQMPATKITAISTGQLEQAQRLVEKGKYNQALEVTDAILRQEPGNSWTALRLRRRIDKLMIEEERVELDKKFTFHYTVQFFSDHERAKDMRGDPYYCNKFFLPPPTILIGADWNPPPLWKMKSNDPGVPVGALAVTDGTRVRIHPIKAYTADNGKRVLLCYAPMRGESIWAWDEPELQGIIEKKMGYRTQKEE